MKSIEWIDRLINEKKLPSDRQAALLLGMTAASMSAHRKGKAVTLDDRYAHTLEQALGLPDGKVVLDQHAERAANAGAEEMASIWRKLASTAAVLTLTVCQLTSPPNSVNSHDKTPSNSDTYGTFT